MEKLQDSHPGPHESWQELAEHSIEHDQLSTEVPDPEAYSRYASRRLAQVHHDQAA